MVSSTSVDSVTDLEVSEDVTEMLQFHDKTWMDGKLFLTDEQRDWFLEMESTLGEEAVEIIGMMTKDLEYYINLAGKAEQGWRGETFNFERSSAVVKTLWNSTAGYREMIRERKSQSMQHTSLLSYIKKLAQSPQPSATTTLTSQQPPTSRSELTTTKQV